MDDDAYDEDGGSLRDEFDDVALKGTRVGDGYAIVSWEDADALGAEPLFPETYVTIYHSDGEEGEDVCLPVWGPRSEEYDFRDNPCLQYGFTFLI